MVEITTLTKATPKSESLRTTVPASIVRHFNLKDGDTLSWELWAEKEGELVVIVKPEK